MADYQVRRTRKDRDGDILALCGDTWRISKEDAIREIESRQNRYYVQEQLPPVFVEVVVVAGRKHLKTNADLTPKNNLDNLPDC